MRYRPTTKIRAAIRPPRKPLQSRRGSLLIVVLVTIIMLSLAAYTFTVLMQTEEEAARLMSRRVQSKYLVDSGVDFTRLFLSYDKDTIREKGGTWDNSNLRGIAVAADPNKEGVMGRFTLITSALDEMGVPEGFRYGLTDESTKLNLNILPYLDLIQENAGRDLLMGLPNMDESIADAIIDWIDSDDEQREYGAESGYYSGLSPAYQCKNGPMDSLDELLLIRDITPQLLFGLDINRNGILDPEENNQATSLDSDMSLGWANYLTLYSKESNLTADGLARINLNSPDLEQLYTDLRSAFNEEWSQFIIMYRVNGPATLEEDEEAPENNLLVPLDFDALEANYTFRNALELVDAYTTVKDPESSGETVIIKSPVRMANLPFTLPNLMRNITTYEGAEIPGRINIMQAPRVVLEGIPGMTPEIVETIIEKREFELNDPDGSDLNRQFETWLLVEGIVDLVTMDSIYPFVCTGGDVYRAEIVGYFDDSVGSSRAEVILDHTIPVPRILFWRDKSHLETGYSLDILGIDLIE
ncbi:MAG: hypothetical protein VYE64_10135 [Planctomycetota bacterium]|nr:hypothetical protein [Planctomycetota bacterium]